MSQRGVPDGTHRWHVSPEVRESQAERAGTSIARSPGFVMGAPSEAPRVAGLDIARGLLLVAMLAVHVISAHGTAEQVNALHGWFGVFLISSGFVGLSGYVIGLRARARTLREVGRGIDRGLQLVLVMFAYGVLFSLLRHGLMYFGPAECTARTGWLPPTRFDDLGILLPIAIVQVLGSLAGAPRRVACVALAGFAIGTASVPALTAGHGGLVLGVLVGRTLTPYYTITTFVAIGLVGVALGRARPRWLEMPLAPAAAILAGGAAAVLAMPPVASAMLDRIYLALGQLAGDLATLAYWSGVLVLFLRAFTACEDSPGGIRGVLGTLGRRSLFVFVLHDCLLVLDAAFRDTAGIGKTGFVVAMMIAVNFAILVAAAWGLERSARARAWVDAVLLGRSRAVSLVGGIVLAGILATYTSSMLAGASDTLVIDDFESASCPKWWTFGSLPYTRVRATDGGQGDYVLDVRGAAPGPYAHGRGIYMDRDIGERRTLVMLIRGDGPGSGKIKIELSEDDNGNWEIEKEPPLYIPLYDDRWVYELSVDWRGWREVAIPMSVFRDDNPGGNGIFDPVRDLTSGGLLEMQLLFAPSSGDEVRLAIDDIRFTP